MASMRRPNVSSLFRFTGVFADAPGSGKASSNVRAAGCAPTVPARREFATTASDTAAVPPAAHLTVPVSFPFCSRSFPLAVPLASTNWPDCASLTSSPRQAEVEL